MVQKQIMHCYLRVSTSVQETKGTFLKTQKDAAIAIAKRLDMDYQIHNEGGKSSSKDDLNNRPVMLELLRLMHAADGTVSQIDRERIWICDKCRKKIKAMN